MNGNCVFCGVEHKSNFFEIEKAIDKIKKIIDILYKKSDLKISLTINKYGRIIELNEVSYQFLEAMKKFNNINDMVDYLSKIYNINSNEIIDDVLDFINQMELCGIIEKKA